MAELGVQSIDFRYKLQGAHLDFLVIGALYLIFLRLFSDTMYMHCAEHDPGSARPESLHMHADSLATLCSPCHSPWAAPSALR